MTRSGCDTGTRYGVTNSEVVWEGQIGSIRSSLIPPLDGCSNGIEDDGEVECFGVPPSMGRLVVQNQTILLGEFRDVIDTAGILSGQSALFEEGRDVRHPIFFGKVLHILQELVFRNSGQRIFDPATCQHARQVTGQLSGTDSPVAFDVMSATL